MTQLQEYTEAIPSEAESLPTKSWNFIKMHYQQHAFDDIEVKGVMKNYNTKPNEKLHRPMRDSYHLCTNYKNVAGQVQNY